METRERSAAVADRIGRWTVLVLIVLMAAHGIQAARGLYADGSFFLLYVLHNDGFFHINPTRYFTEVVTQGPVVLGMHSGVTDVAMLIRIHSFGFIVMPLGLWVGALLAQWRRPMFWALVAMFAVTQLNSGFYVVGEYNLCYALVALSASLLLRPQALTWWQLGVLVVAAVFATLSYEALAYLGPVLIAIAAARVVGVRGIGAAASRPERVALILLCGIYMVATAVAAWSIRNPRIPEQAREAADLWTPLSLDRQFIVSTVIAALVVATPLLPARWRTPAAGAIAVSAAALLLPGIWAEPWLHFKARTLTGLALGSLLVGAVVVQVIVARRDTTAIPRDGDTAPVTNVGLEWVASLALLCAQLVPFTIHNAGYARWAAAVENVVVTSSRPVQVADSGLNPDVTQYSWGWTNPILSRLLREHPGQGGLAPTPQEAASVAIWLPNPLPEPQSRFVKQTRLFP